MNEAEQDRFAIAAQQIDEIEKKLNEIHAFLMGISKALDSPMIRAMMPPGMKF
jgi:hypothetical protein